MTSQPGDRDADPAAADDRVTAWAASGAMALTGWPRGPLIGPPARLVPGLREAGDRLVTRLVDLGGPRLALDPLSLLGERAALTELRPGGQVSCGGATRLLRAGDAWLAVSLARDDDWSLVPAWLEVDDAVDWDLVTAEVRARDAHEVVERALLLGLPAALLPADAASAAHPARAALPGQHGGVAGPVAPRRPGADLPVRREAVPGPASPARPLADLVVVDLSSLWAGPLCGSLLMAAGATVIKVESTTRPDGARRGSPAFFDLLNAGKRSVALDLRTTGGAAALHRLVEAADVVIEASRPRALAQLGIDPRRVLRSGCTRVWASITGHGRSGAGANRAAFGDDAAVAGGLVCWSEGVPCFCADAVADPASGLVAAAAVVEALAEGGRWLLDVSMAAVAAWFAGPTLPVPAGTTALPPRARWASTAAARLGEHTGSVLASLDR